MLADPTNAHDEAADRCADSDDGAGGREHHEDAADDHQRTLDRLEPLFEPIPRRRSFALHPLQETVLPLLAFADAQSVLDPAPSPADSCAHPCGLLPNPAPELLNLLPSPPAGAPQEVPSRRTESIP